MIAKELYARIVEAEASVLPYEGKVGVAQCIKDNNYNLEAFTTPAESYSRESMLAVQNVFPPNGYAKRFWRANILQFRSYKNYGRGSKPDWSKIYSGKCPMPPYYMYLGQDGINDDWGTFYFGRYKNLKPFKLLIIAGHGRNQNGSWDPGAIGCGLKEADLNRELANLIKNCCEFNDIDADLITEKNMCDYFRHGGTYDFTPYNYVLEVHFNASTTPTPVPDMNMKGTMFYIDQRETGHSVEDAILKALIDVGSKQAWDGVVVTQRQAPEGWVVQNRVRAQGVSHAVLETCFISDADDIRWYQKNKEVIATKIVEGIVKGFGLFDQCPNFVFCGSGICSATAKEDMNVRYSPDFGTLCGLVKAGEKVEVLEKLPSGWLKIVWPGAAYGYAYTSNVNGKYYDI